MWIDDDPAAPTTAIRSEQPEPRTYTRDPRPRLTSALTSKAWISIATVVSALSLVVAGIVYFEGEDSSSGLTIAAVTMERPAMIGTVRTSNGGGFDVQTAPVDISIKNTSDAPVRIREIRGEVIYFQILAVCKMGGASGAITASYSLTIPTKSERAPGGEYRTAVADRQVNRHIDFTVKSSSLDRMEISFGPDRQGGDAPPIVALNISLVTADGKVLDVGTAAGGPYQGEVDVQKIWRKDFYGKDGEDCARQNADAVQHAIDMSTVHSPQLTELVSIYRNEGR
ncbi:hypothetical protein [Gordonia iterans]